MKRCLIVTAYLEGAEHLSVNPSEFDEIIAADGGQVHAKTLGLSPTQYIGDYDSSARPKADHLILLPREKDMTDSEAAIDLAMSRGYRNIMVLGGLGGRLDHTMGNIGLLAKTLNSVDWLEFQDGYNRMFMRGPGNFSVERGRFQYLSLIAYDGPAKGLTVENAKYPLSGFTLRDDTTRGVSNEILGSRPEDRAEISLREGKLLVIQSNNKK